MSFYENLRAARKSKNISQEELAERLGVSRQAVSRWEQGDAYPEVEKLIKLADVLQQSLDELVTGTTPAQQTARGTRAPTDKIMIKCADGKGLVACTSVESSGVFAAKADEPKYALFGVGQASFLGESKTFLGWYGDAEHLQKEIAAITRAMAAGDGFYELQYAAKVQNGIIRVKLVNETPEK